MVAWIENRYGEEVAQLKVIDEDEFQISEEDWLALLPAFLCDGDSWTVKTKEME